MPDRSDGRPDDDLHPAEGRGGPGESGGPAEPDVLPATAPPRPRPGAQVAVRRGAAPQLRDAVARLARSPVAVTTALLGAGLAVRLAPVALGREVLRAAPSVLPAARPVAPEPAVVRHVYHHVVHHHVVHHLVHVVVHVRPSPPPGVL